MGVPNLAGELRAFPDRKFGKYFSPLPPLLSNWLLAMSFFFPSAIVMAYVIGIGAFIYTIGRWTFTENSLYWMDI
jgi:hypothetical protein